MLISAAKLNTDATDSVLVAPTPGVGVGAATTIIFTCCFFQLFYHLLNTLFHSFFISLLQASYHHSPDYLIQLLEIIFIVFYI
ncbi:hypothetical protein HanPSC8_Chr03g0097611 [Helianthus annuus]|nr:hypothetical protein HanPSC8_Chr03g0097611 [Helianthus annuus]